MKLSLMHFSCLLAISFALQCSTRPSHADVLTTSFIQDGGKYNDFPIYSFTIGNNTSPGPTFTLKNGAVATFSNLNLGSINDNLYGNIEVLSGSTLSAGSLFIGYGAEAKGMVVVSGEGSKLVSYSGIRIGYGFSEPLGTGNLSIQDSASVRSDGLSITSNGTMSVDGGDVLIQGSFNNEGMVDFISGTITLKDSYIKSKAFAINGVDNVIYPKLVVNNSSGNFDGEMIVGDNARGEIISNAYLNISAMNIGAQKTGYGKITVNGTLEFDDHLYIGNQGIGLVNVTDGGTLVTIPVTQIGLQKGSEGTLNLEGNKSSLGTGSLYIGSGGSGTLNASDGAIISTGNTNIGNLADSLGEAYISGKETTWRNAGNLVVAGMGSGTLSISESATVESDTLTISQDEKSSGTVNIDGVGSMLSTRGGLIIGESGNGQLSVTHGATVSTYDVSVGKNSGSIGTVIILGKDSEWSTERQLVVGDEGMGMFNISDGAVAQIYNIIAGNNQESTGTINITGKGTSPTNISAGTFAIGRSGRGVLNVIDGANLSTFFMNIGIESNSIGTVKIKGEASECSVEYLTIGTHGSGEFIVTDGGKSFSRMVDIGSALNSFGTAAIQGPESSWSVIDLTVGMRDGTGRIDVTDGAKLLSSSVTICQSDSAGATTGIVNVIGLGSEWTGDYCNIGNGFGLGKGEVYVTDDAKMNFRFIHVGSYGSGTFVARDGGSVSSEFVDIGYYKSNLSEAIIGNGSSWTNAVQFIVRSSLTIEDGGWVRVGSENLLNFGTLTGNGGTIIGNVDSYGLVAPGSSPGIMTIDGNYTQLADAKLHIEIAGVGQGTEYDYLHITGLTTLDGLLTIDLLDGFEDLITPTDTFTILTSDGGITGEFTNLDLNHRLNVRQGSFLVSYENNSVVLSDFVAVPELGSLVLAAFGVVGFAAAASRRMASHRT